MKKTITPEQFADRCQHWRLFLAGYKILRLGQHLLNESGITDSEIFYCEDSDKAAKLFFERYVQKDVNPA